MFGTKFSILRYGALGLLIAFSSSARSETINLVDYQVSGGLVAAGFATNTKAELFETRLNGKLASFWARVTVTRLADGGQTISIKHLPIFRLKEIKKRLKLVKNMRKSRVYNFIGLCDAPIRAVRFKERTQQVVSICGTSAGGLKKVDSNMTYAIGKLGQLAQEVQDIPDTVFELPGR